MDGANRKILARLNLRWPNGLALDYPNRFLAFLFLAIIVTDVY